MNSLIKTMLALAVVQAAPHALADADIPYIGQRPNPCIVKTPDPNLYGDIDAGSLSDEKCGTIYVFPPMLGTLKISPPAFLDPTYCPFIERTQDMIAKGTEEMNSAEDLVARTKLAKQLKELRSAMESIGGEDAFSTFSFTASINWQTLIKAYQDANPGKSVMKMPIVTGLLNGSTVNNTGFDFSTNRIVTSLKLYGLSFKDQGANNTDENTKDVIRKITDGLDLTNTYVFGNAIAGQMSLSLIPTCSLFNKTGTIQPLSHFAGTYTFFYPVQTSSSYQIKLDQAGFERQIFAIVKQSGGTITNKQLSDTLASTPTIQIIKREGIGNSSGDADELEKNYKETMKQIVANSVVATIADRITTSVEQSKFTSSEARSERVCRSFVIFNKCSTRVYYVSVTHINWDLVSTKLNNLLGETDPKVSKYRTLYLYGTSALANVGSQQ